MKEGGPSQAISRMGFTIGGETLYPPAMENVDFSTFTAISELFVTAGVLTVVIHNLQRRGFLTKLAFGLVVFEFSVNMLYMISRMQHPTHAELPKHLIIFAAVHGSLSLLVFILFAVYSFLAFSDFRRGKHFFADHKIQTTLFLILWMASVISGEMLYFILPKSA